MIKFKAPFSLTDTEKSICDFLLSANTEQPLTFRIVGGWVRDKLLGRESHDIDIAIDLMTGQQFCKAVGLHSSLIEAAPDQSKHLEVAITEICGTPVEIANLRDETFGDAYKDGRILTENRFGTPEIDAIRRDLSINALFYNVNTGEVEDYVGGVHDLGLEVFSNGVQRVEEGICLRTPSGIDAKQTFKDDPLRMLRILRFFAKIPNAFIHWSVDVAINDHEVKQAFVERVTQERVAVELIGKKEKDDYKPGILSFPSGVDAIYKMQMCGLLDIILNVPQMKNFAPFEMDQKSNYHIYNVFVHTLQVMAALWKHPYFLSLPAYRQSLLMFACLLHDFGKRDPETTQVHEDGHRSYRGHDDSSSKVARAICNKLKFSAEDTEYVVSVCREHMRPHAKGWGTDRVLRRFQHDLPEWWEDVLVHSLADMVGGGVSEDSEKVAEYERMLTRGRELIEIDKNAPLTNKPIISGLVVMQMIPELAPKTGFIRNVNAALLELRLDRPETTEEEYLQKILDMKPDLLAKHGIV